jgi:flagellar operon protein
VTDPIQSNPALRPPGVGPAGAPGAPPRGPHAPEGSPRGPAFADVLRARTEQVQFSKHALQRVERRGIQLEGEILERLHAGVDRAAAKGSRDSVVFLDGTAFVVSVQNRTVVTAVDTEHMQRPEAAGSTGHAGDGIHVFTNIDSAVIA